MFRRIPLLQAVAPAPSYRLTAPIRLLTTATTSQPASPAEHILPTSSEVATPASKPQAPKKRGPYFVSRTFSSNFAVYHERKRGGNLELTVVKKIEGDARTLCEELTAALDLPRDRVTVNSRTNHVIIKGHHQDRVKDWLATRGF